MVVSFNLFEDQAGLTLEAQPIDASSAPIGSPITTGFSEVGLGAYQWTVASLPVGTTGVKIQVHSDHSFTGCFLDLNDLTDLTSIGGGTTYLISGTAAAGSSTTITLANTTSAVNLAGQQIQITGGTGKGQVRTIYAYNASTFVATVPAWDVTPDNTSVYRMIGIETAIVRNISVTP